MTLCFWSEKVHTSASQHFTSVHHPPYCYTQVHKLYEFVSNWVIYHWFVFSISIQYECIMYLPELWAVSPPRGPQRICPSYLIKYGFKIWFSYYKASFTSSLTRLSHSFASLFALILFCSLGLVSFLIKTANSQNWKENPFAIKYH